MSTYRNGNGRENDIAFKVTARLGTISNYNSGWSKELNIISWNGGAAKFDIRDWDPDHEHMSRGITLHEDEARELMILLERRFGHSNRRNDRRNSAPRIKGEWPEDTPVDIPEADIVAEPEEASTEVEIECAESCELAMDEAATENNEPSLLEGVDGYEE